MLTVVAQKSKRAKIAAAEARKQLKKEEKARAKKERHAKVPPHTRVGSGAVAGCGNRGGGECSGRRRRLRVQRLTQKSRRRRRPRSWKQSVTRIEWRRLLAAVAPLVMLQQCPRVGVPPRPMTMVTARTGRRRRWPRRVVAAAEARRAMTRRRAAMQRRRRNPHPVMVVAVMARSRRQQRLRRRRRAQPTALLLLLRLRRLVRQQRPRVLVPPTMTAKARLTARMRAQVRACVRAPVLLLLLVCPCMVCCCGRRD